MPYKLLGERYLHKGPKGCKYWELELLCSEQVGADDLQEVATKDEYRIAGANSRTGQTDLQG